MAMKKYLPCGAVLEDRAGRSGWPGRIAPAASRPAAPLRATCRPSRSRSIDTSFSATLAVRPRVGCEEHDRHAALADLVVDLVAADALEDGRHRSARRPRRAGWAAGAGLAAVSNGGNQFSRTNAPRASCERREDRVPRAHEHVRCERRVAPWFDRPASAGAAAVAPLRANTLLVIVAAPPVRTAMADPGLSWMSPPAIRTVDPGPTSIAARSRTRRSRRPISESRLRGRDAGAERRGRVADDSEPGHRRAGHVVGHDGGGALGRRARQPERGARAPRR